MSRDRANEAELASARRRVSELEAQLVRVASRDAVTGDLLTLKAFRAQLELDVGRAHRYHRPLTVALLDIDGFRELNLRHGYGAGDAVLAACGRTIAGQTRSFDLVCRTSGDEFALMLPETGGEDALAAMRRVVRALEDLEAGPVLGIAASIGVAGLEAGESAEQLLAAARGALEGARAAGGGQVMLYRGSEEEAYEGTSQNDVVAALASALQERDSYTGNHSESVVDMSGRVAEALGVGPDDVARIRTAALLHDIGKVGIPDEVLHKPGPLDEHEWEIIRQHPLIGERILRAIPGMGRIAKIVRHEHERWDGGGYPDGLGEDEIPVGARIILACDAYHAMTSDRPYRRAMEHVDAVAELSRHAGTEFDPDVVEALIGYLYGRRQAGVLTV